MIAFPGQTINGYLLTESLGEGSAGEVWRAERDGISYALKIFISGTDYQDELTAMHLVGVHPHVVKLVDEFEAPNPEPPATAGSEVDESDADESESFDSSSSDGRSEATDPDSVSFTDNQSMDDCSEDELVTDDEAAPTLVDGEDEPVVGGDEPVRPERLSVIVYELCDWTLDCYVGRHMRSLPWPERRREAERLSRQLLRAIEHVHRAGVVHGDIKPENCLVRIDGEQSTLVLTDFGGARVVADADRCYGTAGYKSPEMIVNAKVGYASDVWSATLTCAYIFLGRHVLRVFDAPSSVHGFDDVYLEDDRVPKSGEFEEGYYALVSTAKLIGLPPLAFAVQHRDYYNVDGRLLDHTRIQPISLEEYLARYRRDQSAEWAAVTADIADLLRTGLRYDPEQRPTVAILLSHRLFQT